MTSGCQGNANHIWVSSDAKNTLPQCGAELLSELIRYHGDDDTHLATDSNFMAGRSEAVVQGCCYVLSVLCKPEAYGSTNERHKEPKETHQEPKEIEGTPCPAKALGGSPSCRANIQITLPLTSPTRVAPRKTRTASLYRSSDNKPVSKCCSVLP